MNTIVVVAHDMRSTHNVGSLLRTAECLGAKHVYLTGYTPYPTVTDDMRLPHIHQKLSRAIHKTALGAEQLIAWSHEENIFELIADLRYQGYTIAGLEQAKDSLRLPGYSSPSRLCIILGREVEGIETTLLASCDVTLEIPQTGQKESLNVIQAAAIAIYHCRNL